MVALRFGRVGGIQFDAKVAKYGGENMEALTLWP